MSEYKELYLPFYFNWRDMTEELSDEELGIILRALLDNFADRSVPDELSDKMKIIYKFMLDSAVRTHTGQRELSEKRRESANKRWSKYEKGVSIDANECKSMQTDAIKEKEYENEKENEKENENENVNENENKKEKEREKIKEYFKENEKRGKRGNPRYSDYNPDDAFLNALARSYPTEPEPQTKPQAETEPSAEESAAV